MTIYGTIERTTPRAVLFRLALAQAPDVPEVLLGQKLWLPLSQVSNLSAGEAEPGDVLVQDWLIDRLCQQVAQAA